MTDWQALDDALMDPDWYLAGDIHGAFKTLRDEDPVRRVDSKHYAKKFWAVTRYDDVKYVLSDPSLFSNALGGARMPRSTTRMTPTERHRMGLDVQVTELDPPLHTFYRRPINRPFSVPAIGRLAEDVRSVVDGVLDALGDKKEFDLVDDIAVQIPVRVISKMFGVPESDWDHLQQVVAQSVKNTDPRWMIDNDPMKTWSTGFNALLDYSSEILKKRLESPQDDYTTMITRLRFGDEPLSMHEMRTWFGAVIKGGFETTQNAISVGMWQLLENPDQRQLLIDQPELLPSAIEEILRWTTPARNLMRVVVRDTEVGGVEVRTGDWITPFLISANRDERRFPDPEKFDIARTPNEHLGFGEGVHMCLGRHLVRLELTELLPELLRRFSDLELNGPIRWIRDTSSSGLASLPVRHSVGAARETVA